jgi:sulfide:quinone oxidoreductase
LHDEGLNMRVVVLGAGFAGLELSTRLSEELGDEVDVVLIDRSEGFVFGFSKLDVMFGRTTADAVFHPYAGFVKPHVQFVKTAVRSIDPVAKRVETDAGPVEGDILVIALGADLDPDATPGLREGGYEFYTEPGAFALRDVLAEFGGGRVVIGVTRPPFKCPPAPSETALMMHDLLVHKGVRDQSEITLVMPLPSPVPPSPDASRELLAAFAERGITWMPDRGVRELDPTRRVAVLTDDAELPYDLCLVIPVHVAPPVVVESGLTVDGWIPVDPATLATSHPDVYAVGDVTSVGTPKAGVFSEGQAKVVADQIIARHRGADAAGYDGHGLCYFEFGEGKVGKVDVVFRPGEPPVGHLDGPSIELARDKAAFGSTRARRWFGREWSNV